VLIQKSEIPRRAYIGTVKDNELILMVPPEDHVTVSNIISPLAAAKVTVPVPNGSAVPELPSMKANQAAVPAACTVALRGNPDGVPVPLVTLAKAPDPEAKFTEANKMLPLGSAVSGVAG
jgi:hypothetical protein